MTIARIFAALRRLVGLYSEEDRVIDLAKKGDVEPFIKYFTENDVKFRAIDHRRRVSPTGRVMYEDDIYSYVYVDGLWVNRIEFDVPYDIRSKWYERMETAVMMNVYGTTHYEQAHFANERKEA